MRAVEVSDLDRAGRIESWLSWLWRRWSVGLIVFVPMLGLAAAIVLLARPIYRAEARLRLGEPPPMSGVSPTASFFGLVRLGGDPFANDLELLTSRTLVERVVRERGLHARLIAPRGWHRDSVFHQFDADTTTRAAMYEIAWSRSGAVTVRMDSPRDSVIGSTRAGESIAFGGVTAVLKPWRDGMPSRVRLKTVPYRQAVQQAGPRLRAERSRRDANVVDITFDGPDPALARAVVGAQIDRFIELRTAIQRRESGQTVDSLRVVAQQTQRELDAAESALESWQQETRLVSPDVQGRAFVERYSELLAQVEEVKLELDAIIAVVARLESAVDTPAAWPTLLTHPRFLANETVGALIARVTELEQRRAELATRRAVTSREYGVLVEQIRQMDRTLRDLAAGYRIALADQLSALQVQAAAMDRALAGTPAQAIELGRRQRAIRLLSEIIIVTEQRLRQEEMRQALTFSNVQVVDPPAVLFKPIWPRRTIGMGAGFLIASAFALLAMLIAERADRTVRRASEIERVLGAPVLAVALSSRAHAPALSEQELRAVARQAATNGQASRVSVAPVEPDARAERIAHALANGDTAAHLAGDGGRARDAADAGLPLTAAPAVDTFAAAASIEGAVALVVHYGRTRRDALARAAHLLNAAGAHVVGAIVVCEKEREAAALRVS